MRKFIRILSYLEKQAPLLNVSIGYILIGVVSICNIVIGIKINIFILYVIPVAYLTWFISRKAGIIASFVCVISWFWISRTPEYSFPHILIPICNSLLSFFLFLIITLFFATVNNILIHTKELTYIDDLTGAVNSSYFITLLQKEMERLERYKQPFTLVYFDLDNFKEVNDNFGHLYGNHVLLFIVNYIKIHLRKVDVIARLGGDEFAILLPETSQESARTVIKRLQSGLLEEMKQKNLSITLSIGVVTCNTVQCTANELVEIADNLMYSIKKNGKNAIKYT